MLEILVLVLFVRLSIKAIGIARGYPKTKNVLAKIKRECAEKIQKLKEEGYLRDRERIDKRGGFQPL